MNVYQDVTYFSVYFVRLLIYYLMNHGVILSRIFARLEANETDIYICSLSACAYLVPSSMGGGGGW